MKLLSKNKAIFSGLFSIMFFSLCISAIAQSPTPQILYYKFNDTGTTVRNLATNPPSGTSTASVLGGLSIGSGGVCNSRALIGSGNSSTNDYVNTGWVTNLSGSWTLSLWTSNIGSSTTLFYIFGDASAGSFRCFTNGVAGANNWMMRGGGFPDVLLQGGATTGNNVSTFVRDSAAGEIRAYLNGTLVTTVSTTANGVSGTGPFKVNGYATNVGLPSGGLMDEFRFYSRALTNAEVAGLAYVQSTSTITRNQCGGTYISPSGKTLTTSGTYLDTIPNTRNCDSIITINLTIGQHTTSTLNPVVCGSYISPSGKSLTQSGTYIDTISNFARCDSIITINLTVNNPSFDTLSPVVCNTFTSPSGKYIWTSSGQYRDTLVNSVGCDSLILINLTVNRTTTSSISPVVCDVYQSPSGRYLFTSSGNYHDTVPNFNNCDSVITINLTVNNSTFETIAPIVCNSYESPSRRYVWTASGTYQDTIPNSRGCDSVLTIDLTVNYTTTESISPSACESYVSPSGKYTWTQSGLYTDTIANSNGCDSIITLNLVVHYNNTGTISPSVCDQYVSPSGKIFKTDGTYSDTIPTIFGCDSVISINLTIKTVDISVSRSGFTLSAADATATKYQWLNCANNFAPISGESNRDFEVTANGNYAVEITAANSCVDTSACINVTNVSTREHTLTKGMAVYPNPTGGAVTITFTQDLNNATIKVLSVTGQLISEVQGLNGNVAVIDLSRQAAGVYFVEVTENGLSARVKIIRN